MPEPTVEEVREFLSDHISREDDDPWANMLAMYDHLTTILREGEFGICPVSPPKEEEKIWFDWAAFDIFIADGGVDDFDFLTAEEVEKIVARVLPDFVSNVRDAAIRLRDNPEWRN